MAQVLNFDSLPQSVAAPSPRARRLRPCSAHRNIAQDYSEIWPEVCRASQERPAAIDPANTQRRVLAEILALATVIATAMAAVTWLIPAPPL